jgi:hypothetical protein
MGKMLGHDKLLVLLASADQAEAAVSQILALDAGEDVDALAESLAITIDEMRIAVQELLRSP